MLTAHWVKAAMASHYYFAVTGCKIEEFGIKILSIAVLVSTLSAPTLNQMQHKATLPQHQYNPQNVLSIRIIEEPQIPGITCMPPPAAWLHHPQTELWHIPVTTLPRGEVAKMLRQGKISWHQKAGASTCLVQKKMCVTGQCEPFNYTIKIQCQPYLN